MKHKKILLLLLLLGLAIIGLVYLGAWPANNKSTVLRNSIGMELLSVKAGTFLYGAPREMPRECMWSPRLISKASLTKDYYLGKYEVTQSQFKKIMATNPSRFQGRGLPVDSVTWEEAVEFCKRLSELPGEKKAGRVYSLPTSAEWEYACRAGSEDVFPWGNEDETRLGDFAWCRDWYGLHSDQTHQVGKKQPNAWGFYDMLGNVWEWCCDDSISYGPQTITYKLTPQTRKEGLVDPHYPLDPSQKTLNKVIRGGGWKSDCRSANCIAVYGQRPLCRDNDTGFRVKCVL